MADQLRVFVSHSHEDDEFCREIVASLSEAGADVWYDEHNLGSGQLKEVILRELGSRPIFVLILSKSAIASRWVKREADWAEELIDRNPTRVFLPVTAAQIDRDDFGTDNGWLAFYGYKRIEASGYNPYPAQEAANRLLHALSLAPTGDAPMPIEPQPNESVDDLLIRGRALNAQGDYSKALPFFERATQLAPNSFDAWVNLGLARNEAGLHGEDLKAYDRALAIDDTQAWAWLNKAKALSDLDLHAEALDAMNHVLDLEPDDAIAWMDKGTVLNGLERYQDAVDAFDHALELNPALAVAWLNKGIALKEMWRDNEALDAYERALEIDPELPSAWHNKGIALIGRLQWDEALDAFDHALALAPHSVITLEARGKVFEILKQYDESVEAYERALSLDPTNAEIWHNMAISLRGLGRSGDAWEADKRAKELGWEDD